MSLEQALAENTAAMKELAAALKASGLSAGNPGTTETKPGKTETKKAETKKEEKAAYQPQHTADEMIALLTKLKDEKGLPEAKKIVKEVGKKDKMSEITDPETIDKVYAAAEKALGKAEEGSDDGL